MGDQGRINIELLNQGFVDTRNKVLKNKIGQPLNVTVVHIPRNLTAPIYYQGSPGVEIGGNHMSTMIFDGPKAFVEGLFSLNKIDHSIVDKINETLGSAMFSDIATRIAVETKKAPNLQRRTEIIKELQMIINSLEYKDRQNADQVAAMIHAVLFSDNDHETDVVCMRFAKKFIKNSNAGMTIENSIKDALAPFIHLY